MSNADTVYKINEMIVSRKDKSGANLLVSLDETQHFFRIDGLASQVWDELKEGKSVSTITQSLIDRHPDHKDQILKDVEAFIKKLIEMNIIHE